MAKKILAAVLAVMIAISAMAVNVFADVEIPMYPANNQQVGSQDYSSRTQTVTFTIPIYALYGYMDSNHYIQLHLPSNLFASNVAPNATKVSWAVVVNGNRYLLPASDITKEADFSPRIYFGYFPHDYAEDSEGKLIAHCTIPQSTVYGDLNSIQLVATGSFGEWWGGFDPNSLNGKYQYYAQVCELTDQNDTEGTPIAASTSYAYSWAHTESWGEVGNNAATYRFVTCDWTYDTANGHGIEQSIPGYPFTFDNTLANRNTLINADQNATAQIKIALNNPLNGQAVYTLYGNFSSNASQFGSYNSNWWYFNNSRQYIAQTAIDGQTSELVFDVPVKSLYDATYGAIVQEFVVFENITLWNQSVMKSYLRMDASKISGGYNMDGAKGALGCDYWAPDNTYKVYYKGNIVRYASGGITDTDLGTITQGENTEPQPKPAYEVVYVLDANNQKIKNTGITTYKYATEPVEVTEVDAEGKVVLDDNGQPKKVTKQAVSYNSDGTFKVTTEVEEYITNLMAINDYKNGRVPVLDEQGNKVPAKDESGNYLADENGNLLYLYTDGVETLPVNVMQPAATATEVVNIHKYQQGVDADPARATSITLVIPQAEAEEPGDQEQVDQPVESTDNENDNEQVEEPAPEVDAPADNEPTTPVDTTPVEQNPGTGIALAVVPMLMVAAVAVVAKKH